MTYIGKLRQYQKIAVDFITNKKSTLIGYDLGLGKTHISMAYCEQIKPQNESVLVLCPSAIIYQWKEEIERYTDSKVIVINGDKKKRRLQWEEDSYYYVTNYEKLRVDAQIFQKVWGVVILDECTKIKSPKAQITRKSYQLRANKKICLSGTPIHNSPNDLYSICQFLYPFMLGTWWQFANRYIEYELKDFGGRCFNEIVGFKNLDELHDRIKMFFIRKKKEDVLTELPPVIYETLTCQMNPNQYKVYEEIMDEIITTPKGENCLHLFTALKLLSNHPTLLKETGGEKIKKFSPLVDDLTSNKLKVLLEFIEDNKDKKIVIFSEYVLMLKIISKNLNIPHRMFHGKQTKEENNQALHDFREDNNIKLFLSSKAGSYGVNLQCASVVINYDLPYSVADYFQREGRVHRIGQKSSVVVVNIINQNSIEKKVLEILFKKQNMIDQIIEGKITDNIFTDILLEMKNEKTL